MYKVHLNNKPYSVPKFLIFSFRRSSPQGAAAVNVMILKLMMQRCDEDVKRTSGAFYRLCASQMSAQERGLSRSHEDTLHEG